MSNPGSPSPADFYAGRVCLLDQRAPASAAHEESQGDRSRPHLVADASSRVRDLVDDQPALAKVKRDRRACSKDVTRPTQSRGGALADERCTAGIVQPVSRPLPLRR